MLDGDSGDPCRSADPESLLGMLSLHSFDGARQDGTPILQGGAGPAAHPGVRMLTLTRCYRAEGQVSQDEPDG